MSDVDYTDTLAYWPDTSNARCPICQTLLTAAEATLAQVRGALELTPGESPKQVLDVVYTCAACGVASYQRFTQ